MLEDRVCMSLCLKKTEGVVCMSMLEDRGCGAYVSMLEDRAGRGGALGFPPPPPPPSLSFPFPPSEF